MISLNARGLTRRGWLISASAVAASTALAACQKSSGAGFQGSVSSAQTKALQKALADAPTHGFAPTAFRANGDDPGALVTAVAAYAKALHGLAIPKSAMDPNWGMRPAAYDPMPELQAALAQNRVDAWLASLAPPLPEYEPLRKGYLVYLKVAQSGGWQPIPAGPELRPGSRDPRVGLVRARLAFEDASVNGKDAANPYDAALAGAVQRFQHRHGLKETGTVDAPTLEALNVPAVARAAQIRANLERLRWAPRETPASRIDVNSAAGLFDLYLDGQPALHMLAASGKPGDETPIVASKIHTIVLNPTWTVPKEIAQNELLPKGDAYLSSHNFTQNGDQLVQQPGPDNALGRIKFLFDNPYSVYLHDTPAKAAFDKPQRQVSHGCVRLEKALDLGRLLLSRNADWPAGKMDEVLAGQDTVSAPVKPTIPVRIFYSTAFAEGDQISFRQDVYGWDAATLKALDGATSTPT